MKSIYSSVGFDLVELVTEFVQKKSGCEALLEVAVVSSGTAIIATLSPCMQSNRRRPPFSPSNFCKQKNSALKKQKYL